MRKLLVIIGIFGVLSVGMFISGCRDWKQCSCTRYFSGPGSGGMMPEQFSDQVYDNTDCDTVLNETTTSETGLVTTITCVGNH